MTLADTHRKTSDIFEIVQRYYNNHGEAPKRKGVGNSYRMDFPSLNSRFICGTAAASSEARGGTFQRIHGSEVAFWCQGGNQKDKQREVMAGLEEAAAEGEIVLESTPNGMDLFHDIYNAAKRGENDYTPIFLPWYMDESNRVDVELDEAEHIMLNLSDREEELIRLHQLDVNQIKWRRRTEKRLGPLFRQEHPEDDVSCFLTGGTCRFDTKICVDLLEGYRTISTNAYLVLKSACSTLIRTRCAGLSRFRVLNTLSDVILQKACQAATVVVLALCAVIRLNRSLQSTACSLLKNWRNMPSAFARNTTMLFSALKGKITGTRS